MARLNTALTSAVAPTAAAMSRNSTPASRTSPATEPAAQNTAPNTSSSTAHTIMTMHSRLEDHTCQVDRGFPSAPSGAGRALARAPPIRRALPGTAVP